MKIYCGILFICVTILTSNGNALEIMKPQQNGAIPGAVGISSSTIGAVTGGAVSKSPVYRSIPQVGRQMKDHVPVRLKVYGNNPNGPPKVVARYAPPPSYHSPVRYFRPAPGMIPAIRRRYQISNGPPPSSMSQHKRMTPASYPPNNYNKVRRYPTKSYKYPVYYKKKQVSGNYNSELPRKGYYQQSQSAGGGPPLEPKISGNPHRQHPNKKNFYPSPHFDGKVIMKPNGEKYTSGNSGDNGYGKTQYTSHQQHVNFPEHSEHHYHYKPVNSGSSSSSSSSSNMREREPSPSSFSHQDYYQSNRHYGNSPNYPNLNKYGVNNENNSPYGNKYSSYSVYDDSDTDDDDDSDSYATDSPVKYYVESNTDSNINSNNHNNNNQIAEAKKYLEFMSSSNYFLPKVSPDYHTKSIGYNNFNIPTATEPISSKLNIQSSSSNNNNEQLYQNYKSQRINLGPGSSTGIRISSKISTSGNGANTVNNNNNNPSNVDSIIVGQHSNHQYDIDDSSQQQNTFYRPSRKHHQLIHHQHHGPEKIEFTESDAIHSSYTSNPKEILDQSASSLLYGGNSDGVGSNNGGSSIASAVDDIKAKYGLSPKYKVSYQSQKISHLHPHRIIKYQASSHSKNNNHNNDDRDDDDNDDDDTHNDNNDDDIHNDDDDGNEK